MKLKSNEYQIECTLSDIADEFFSEVNEVYLAEELA